MTKLLNYSDILDIEKEIEDARSKKRAEKVISLQLKHRLYYEQWFREQMVEVIKILRHNHIEVR